METFGPLVSTDWLADHSRDAGVKIVDGSWRMPGLPLARADYDRRHIYGAVFFDIDDIADKTSDLPHMLPSPANFEKAVGALGISEKDKVVVYDDQGLFSAPRVWWTFRAMGHEDVAVLNGGLPKWLDEGRPVVNDTPPPKPAKYHASPRPSLCASADDVRARLDNSAWVIADARPSSRFRGEAPEPRPGLRSGHMPGARSTPYGMIIDQAGMLKSPEELRAFFLDAGVDLDKSVITSCGSGVSAAILSLALEILGCENHAVYDGSWTEWGDLRNAAEEFPVIAAM